MGLWVSPAQPTSGSGPGACLWGMPWAALGHVPDQHLLCAPPCSALGPSLAFSSLRGLVFNPGYSENFIFKFLN